MLAGPRHQLGRVCVSRQVDKETDAPTRENGCLDRNEQWGVGEEQKESQMYGRAALTVGRGQRRVTIIVI